VGALVAALAAPSVEQLLSDLGESLAPAFDEIIFTLLLPLGYLAALVYAILEPLLRRWSFFGSPAPQAVPRDDPALLREIERSRRTRRPLPGLATRSARWRRRYGRDRHRRPDCVRQDRACHARRGTDSRGDRFR